MDRPVVRPLHFYLRDHGRVLSTRANGRVVAEHLRVLTEQEGDLIIDFDGVEVATPPFLQELLRAVQEAILRDRETGRIVVAARMNDDVAETLSFVLARTNVAIPHQSGSEIELLHGKPHLAATLREAQRLRSFTAPQLAKRLEIKNDAATQRLKRLLEAGAVAREKDPETRQGVRHLYRAATPDLLRARR